MKAEQSGALIWSGRSRLDASAPIAVLVTWTSSNVGTGPMAQTWILRTDMHPIDAIRSGTDRAVCPEACGLRVTAPGRASGDPLCYAAGGRTALSLGGMYDAIKADRYPHLTPREAARRLTGLPLRMAAYGDPAAPPASVHAEIVRYTSGHTGYTHAPELAPALRGLIMASADTLDDAEFRQAQGWRTYGVRRVDAQGQPEAAPKGAIVCPKSSEAGKRLTCSQCLLCDGTDGRSAKSIVIADHSAGAMLRRRRATGDLAHEGRVMALRRSRDGLPLAAGHAAVAAL